MDELPPLIGPHESRELSLMLEGTKKFALFCDRPEVIEEKPQWLPEDVFAPHVAAGYIIRHSRDIETRQGPLRYIGFTLPGEEWRFEAAIFLRTDMHKNPHFYSETDADDVVMGRLLGYSKEEIRAFLAHRKQRRAEKA